MSTTAQRSPGRRTTFADLRAARKSGQRLAMLTCYDYWSAVLMHKAGVPMILAGDSAASVILGHTTTLPVSLDFMIEITAAVRRGAPDALLVADMPFGSYQASEQQGIENVFRMVKSTDCDGIKMELAANHAPMVQKLADAGVPVIAHLGLKPQSVNQLGTYRFQGRTADEANEIVALALHMERSGAAAILLEAVPPEVASAVVGAVQLPVIGCGAGPACHAHVVVTHDALGLTARRPRFVPNLADLSGTYVDAMATYVRLVAEGTYPSPDQQYEMPVEELKKFRIAR